MTRRRAAIATALLTGALATTGCVERRMFITSEPSGARVHLNDQDVGITPLEVDFTWFGVYDVRVTRHGYEPLITSREAKAPLHEIPPFDLAAILLVPGTKRTHIDWHFELELAHNDPDALLQNAEELRDRVRLEAAQAEAPAPALTPPPPPPPPAQSQDPPAPVNQPADGTRPDYQEIAPSGK